MAVARAEFTADECYRLEALVKASRDPELRRARRELKRAAAAARESEARERARRREMIRLLPHLQGAGGRNDEL